MDAEHPPIARDLVPFGETRVDQMRRYAVRNVIGHSESLSSPYHRERVAAFKGRTHGDMSRSTMMRYRRLLRSGR